MKTLTDRAALLLTGGVAAVGAAVFWRSTGTEGFSILTCVALVWLMLDNRQLRRRLRRLESTR